MFKGIGSRDVYFLKAYDIKLVFSAHKLKVLKVF
jgi:hypothetical protein